MSPDVPVRIAPQADAVAGVYRKIGWRLLPFLLLCYTMVSDPSNPTLPHSRRSRMLRPVISDTERTCKRDWNSGHPT